jgi:YVTN family beta-propeller protein
MRQRSFKISFFLFFWIISLGSTQWEVMETINLIPGGNKVNGRGPRAVAFSEKEQKIFVANWYSGSLSVIDLPELKVVNLKVGDLPLAVSVSDRFQKVFVANYKEDEISIIDLARNNQIINLKVGKNPCALGIFEGSQQLVVANRGSESISIIDLLR